VLAAAHVQYAGRSLRRNSLHGREGAPAPVLREGMADRVRDGAEPPYHISLEAAVRALPGLGPFDERELSRLIGQLCRDFASTRRYLVDEGLMAREAGIYRFTTPGESVWRVERFLRERYMGSLAQ
jgi:hypothetical protein